MAFLFFYVAESPNSQIFALIVQSVLTLCLQLSIKPYASQFINFIEIFNEVSILAVLYGILSINITAELEDL